MLYPIKLVALHYPMIIYMNNDHSHPADIAIMAGFTLSFTSYAHLAAIVRGPLASRGQNCRLESQVRYSCLSLEQGAVFRTASVNIQPCACVTHKKQTRCWRPSRKQCSVSSQVLPPPAFTYIRFRS